LLQQVEANGVLVPTAHYCNTESSTSAKVASPLYQIQQTPSKHYYG